MRTKVLAKNVKVRISKPFDAENKDQLESSVVSVGAVEALKVQTFPKNLVKSKRLIYSWECNLLKRSGD